MINPGKSIPKVFPGFKEKVFANNYNSDWIAKRQAGHMFEQKPLTTIWRWGFLLAEMVLIVASILFAFTLDGVGEILSEIDASLADQSL